MGFQTFNEFDPRWGYNKAWHNVQDLDHERYGKVLPKNHEIKITTDINNIYWYVRAMGIDEFGDPFIEPTLWAVTKNGYPVMIDDPENPGTDIQSTIEISNLDGLIRSIYASDIEIPIEIMIN